MRNREIAALIFVAILSYLIGVLHTYDHVRKMETYCRMPCEVKP